MKNFCLRSLLLSFSVLALAGLLLAQNQPGDSRVTGTIFDASGGGVGQVRISAHAAGSSSNDVWKATSTNDGKYTLVLPPGSYTVEFERPSFLSRQIAQTLKPGESRTLDLTLEVQRISSNIVVTASVQPLEIARTPASVTLITRSEIDRRQATSLPDLLASQPGIAMARTGAVGGLATIFLDGGNSNFTKVLIDGTPVNQPGGFFNLSNLTLDNIDKVEIVHGAESALYGSDAMAGVVQLITHRGTTRIPEVRLFAEGGSLPSARGGGQLSGAAGRFDYSTAASYFQTDGQGPNDAFLNRTLSGNVGWKFSDTNEVRLSVRNNSSAAGIPGPVLFAPADLTHTDSLKLLSGNLAWDFHTSPRWRHYLSVAEMRYIDLDKNASFLTTTAYNRVAFKGQSTYSFDRGAITGGYLYEVENGFPGVLGGLHARRNNQAGYLDGRWLPMSRVTFSAGVRAEANASFGTRVSPRAGVVLAVRYARGFWGDTRARFAYGQGIKEPEFGETFGADPCFPGNPGLRPARSRTLSAGIDQFLAGTRIKISGTYFSNRYMDIISFGFVPTTNPGCPFGAGSFFNTDLARARGLNFSAEARPLSWLTLGGSYSYDSTRVLKAPNAFDPVQLPGNRLLRRPANSGTFLLNAAYRRVNFNFTGYFTGRRTDSDFLGLGFTSNPGYARFDLATSVFIARGVSFTARAWNLFDKRYQDVLGYPALGRDFRLGIDYRFGGRK